MPDCLSEQIGAFRRQFRRYVDGGGALSWDAVEALNGVFASFQAQARVLEGGAPTLEMFDDVCRAVSSEAKAVAELATRLQATATRLRAAEVLPFRARGEG